jgi:NADP-dependent 3-hydroxy acid dehydrogenase YdfG
MDELRNRSIVVTGASSGIGAAIVRRLAGAGARMTMGARRVDRLDVLAREVDPSGVHVAVVRTDMRVEADVVRLVATARERFGGVDALVNNAGLGRKAPIVSAATELWREMLEVNVLGLLIATREAIRDMEARRAAGHVVHVSSMAGHRVPGPDSGVYAGTKFAVRAITEGLRQELRTRKSAIRVSCVSPGYVDTEFASVFAGPGGTPTTPDVKTLDADDVARTVEWILVQPPHVQVHDVLMRPTEQRN